VPVTVYTVPEPVEGTYHKAGRFDKLSDRVAKLNDRVAKLSDRVAKLSDRVAKLSDRVAKYTPSLCLLLIVIA
jgi:predicted nuclease with TOPRIM domain